MTKREWQLAIPLLISLGLCLAGFLHGQQLANPSDGIAALRVFNTAAHGERVAVIANNALHLLDPQGHRVARQDLKALGLTERPNDMDWTVDDQQRVEAWFFDDATVPRVLRCAWSFEQAQLVDCRTAMEGPQLKASAHSRAVHLAVDRNGQRVFIADANGDRVQVFDMAGKPLASTDPQVVPLFFPNRLRYLGDDTLVVADNDHRRLVWVHIPPGQPAQLGRTLRSADHGHARPGRGKVTDAAFGPNGTVWMLAMKQGQKEGDVLVFDAQHRPVARAALEDGADPLVIDALGDNTALVADFSLIKLHHVDAQGRNLGEFGDDAFRGELKTLQERVQAGAWWKTGAMVGGGCVIVMGLVLGMLFGEKPKRPGQFDIQAKAALEGFSRTDTELRFPVVLNQTAAYRKALRQQLLGVGLATLLMAIVLGAMPVLMLGNLNKILGNWKVPAIALLAVATPCLCFWLLWRELWRPTELRVTENRLGWVQGGDVVCAAALQDIHASTNAMLMGTKLIRFRMLTRSSKPGEAMFDMDVFNRAVLARLPTQNLVNDQALAWLAFKKRPLAQRLLLGGLFVVAVLLAFAPLFR
nr:hypothetical protein [Rhodoferax sp.]